MQNLVEPCAHLVQPSRSQIRLPECFKQYGRRLAGGSSQPWMRHTLLAWKDDVFDLERDEDDGEDRADAEDGTCSVIIFRGDDAAA
mmetsp:Transcript_21574/g.32670  ORF Transcript_21574/g.32670 Transcript_21574/m.32670 type:complete len:86 (+) Transcript_21574:551-808(+)